MNTRREVVDNIMSDLVIGIRETLEAQTKSCLNCISFNEQTEVCTKFNQRPPARVIAFACENYEDDHDIPF